MRLPYPGLRPFQREESDLFFGREGCIDDMVDRLAATRFLAVLGASGSGKSSLVITGLLDALEIGLHARAGSRWRIALLRPGSRPTENLARVLLSSAETERPVEGLDVELLSSYLRRGPRSVAEWCHDGNLAAGTNLLILVDQFEELFRYGDYAGREEAEAFVALLLESARAADAAIHVTITMRSEYLGACALIPGLAERINAGLYLAPRMSREEVRSAIEGPAAVCGFSIEPALVNRLLNDLTSLAPWEDDRSGDQLQRLSRRADQLPLMQHVLNRMWMRAAEAAGDGPVRLRLVDYDALGGLTGALDAHAGEVFDALDAADRPVVATVFRALIGGTTLANAVRRPCRVEELVAMAGGNRAAVTRVVEAFRTPDCNFLTPPPQTPLHDATIIDISHESLIRQWGLLRDWVRAEFGSSETYRHIEISAQLWTKGESGLLTMPYLGLALAWRRDEHPNAAWATRYGGDFDLAMRFLEASGRRRRQRRVLVAAMVALLVVGSGAFGIYQFRRAKTSEAELQTAQTSLNRAQQALEHATSQLKDLNLADELTDFGIPPQETLKVEVGTPTPRTIPGGIVVPTLDLNQIVKNRIPPFVVDALAGNHLATIPGAVRIPFAGEAGDWNDFAQHRLKVRLDNLTNGNLDATLVFFCSGARCWESYNASLRAMHAGYRHVYWYRGGLSSWEEAVLPTENIFEKAQELKDELAKSSTMSAQQRWALAVSMSEIGEALSGGESVMDSVIAEETLARNQLQAVMPSLPNNPDLLADSMMVSLRLGAVFGKTKQTDAAIAAYRDAQATQQKLTALVEKLPELANWRINLSNVDRILGDGFYEQKKYDEAIQAYLAAEAIDKAAAGSAPANSALKRWVWVDLRRIGASLRSEGKSDDALARYREAFGIVQPLLDKEPQNTQWLRCVSITQREIGVALHDSGNLDDALAAYKVAIAAAQTLVKNDAADTQAKDELDTPAAGIGGLAYKFILASEFAKALDAADFAIALEPDAIWMQGNRAHALMFLGKVDQAREIYLRYRGQKSNGDKLWEADVKDDFADLRKHGLTNPLMDEIEKVFGES